MKINLLLILLLSTVKVLCMEKTPAGLSSERARSQQEQMELDSAFIDAVYDEESLGVIQELYKKGASINNVWNYSQSEGLFWRLPSPLCIASGYRNIPHMQFLLENGASVDVYTSFGSTPLTNALTTQMRSNSALAAVRLLLTHGANPHMPHKDWLSKPLNYVQSELSEHAAYMEKAIEVAQAEMSAEKDLELKQEKQARLQSLEKACSAIKMKIDNDPKTPIRHALMHAVEKRKSFQEDSVKRHIPVRPLVDIIMEYADE